VLEGACVEGLEDGVGACVEGREDGVGACVEGPEDGVGACVEGPEDGVGVEGELVEFPMYTFTKYYIFTFFE